MSETLDELKQLPDEELVRRHDARAALTVVGTSHYLDELRSRSNSRLSESVERMTRKILWLTIVVTVATMLQLALAISSFFAR